MIQITSTSLFYKQFTNSCSMDQKYLNQSSILKKMAIKGWIWKWDIFHYNWGETQRVQDPWVSLDKTIQTTTDYRLTDIAQGGPFIGETFCVSSFHQHRRKHCNVANPGPTPCLHGQRAYISVSIYRRILFVMKAFIYLWYLFLEKYIYLHMRFSSKCSENATIFE